MDFSFYTLAFKCTDDNTDTNDNGGKDDSCNNVGSCDAGSCTCDSGYAGGSCSGRKKLKCSTALLLLLVLVKLALKNWPNGIKFQLANSN